AATLAPPAEDDVEVFVFGNDVTDDRAARRHDRQQERLAAVGTLAAGLAHEIRNPLNGAHLHLSLLERALKKTPGSDDALESVHVVRDEIQRLARLVTEFLDFARPRPLLAAPTSVRGLCERVIQLVQARDNVALQLDLPATDVVLEADKDRLAQVFLNLLQNALDAVTGKGTTVCLRARREPRHVWIEVEDDGPGIAENAPVFDAFFSTKPNGTGLGLAIAHRVVTDHGGTIDVESKPGRTRFRVNLPLVAREGED
ncbi:MAG TPA: ATP-binding protein, partial [Labilithrix sp.]|nr:ATP-binding protein [Labilithrix sp.]